MLQKGKHWSLSDYPLTCLPAAPSVPEELQQKSFGDALHATEETQQRGDRWKPSLSRTEIYGFEYTGPITRSGGQRGQRNKKLLHLFLQIWYSRCVHQVVIILVPEQVNWQGFLTTAFDTIRMQTILVDILV